MEKDIQNHLDQLPARGIWSAALTPLKSDLSIDCGRLARHAKLLLDNGCHCIGLFGTTGEANAFAAAERMSSKKIRKLAVTENGKITGIITSTDLVNQLAK